MNFKTWACLLLVLATLGIYWQAGNHEFINYDDPAYVLNNNHVAGGLGIQNILWAFSSIHASNWHPVTWMSHMLDVQLFGLEPKGHHLANVFLHVFNSLLLYYFLVRTTNSPWKSLFVAACFALHPLHVESVAWVAERKDVLCALFWLIALILYEGYARRPGFSRYLSVLFAFSLGLMSKPMAVTLPFVMLLMDFWPLQRISLSNKPMNPQEKTDGMKEAPSFKRLVLEKLPFLPLILASAIITIYAQHKGGTVAKIEGVPLSFRFVNALVAYCKYLWKTIWPMNLSVIYPLPATLTLWQGLGSGLFLTGITFLFLRKARRHPYLTVGWLWYVGTLIPVIGLVQVGSQSMADRYTYIPLIGIFIIAAWGIPSLMPEHRFRNAILSLLAIVPVLSFAAATWIQLGYWKNSITLFRHAAEAVADNTLAHNLLGNTFLQEGKFQEATSHFSLVLRTFPHDEEALTGMGIVLAKQGKPEEAVPYFRRALAAKPGSAENHAHLGFALMQEGKDREAISHLLEAIRLDPDGRQNAEIHFHIAIAFASHANYDESVVHFSKAIQLKPDFVEAHYNLGVAFAKQGKLEPAIASFTKALQLKPDLPEAAISREKAILMKGK